MRQRITAAEAFANFRQAWGEVLYQLGTIVAESGMEMKIKAERVIEEEMVWHDYDGDKP